MGYQVHLLQLVFCQLADAFCRHRISCIEGAMHNLQPLQLSTLAPDNLTWFDLHLRLWDSLSFPNPTWKHVVQNWGKMDLELRVFTETQDSHVNSSRFINWTHLWNWTFRSSSRSSVTSSSLTPSSCKRSLLREEKKINGNCGNWR